MLRSTTNGTIQHGHKFGLLDIALALFMLRKEPAAKESAKRFHELWQTSLNQLPPGPRDKLMDIRVRMHIEVLEQLIMTSALVFCTLFPIVGWAVLYKLWKGSILRALSSPSISIFTDKLDSTAGLCSQAA